MDLIKSEHIILKPILTEKSLVAHAVGKYTFLVSRQSSKFQIAKAFETVFGVKPLNVNTNTIKGKQKTDWKKRLPIKKPDEKMAIITIPKDKKIELLNLSN
jgi:large subunit ribosomal protein L23